VVYPFLLKKLLIRTGLAGLLPRSLRGPEGAEQFLRYHSNRLLAAPLEEAMRLAAGTQAHGPDVIDLSQGSPQFDLLPTSSTKLPADRRGWPPVGGLPELRAAVAERLRAEGHRDVGPAGVLITAGALGALHVILDAFVNRGDRVVLLDPTSPIYPVAVQSRRARVRWLGTWFEGGQTRFRLHHLARALGGAKMLVLPSPGNPAGTFVAPADLEQVAWWADRHDVLLVSDEVFGSYRYEGEVVPLMSLEKARRRTLTVGGVSKGHALASARVGWVAGDRHLIRACLETAAVRAPFVATLSQQMALSALAAAGGAFAAVRAEFESRRRYAYERLRAMELAPAWPSGAFFLWVPVWELGLGGRQFAEGLLREQKVAVTPGDLFGPSGPGHVRISYAVEDGRLQEGLHRLAEHVQALRGDGADHEARRAA
jgi:aspartate/methionine/tyrosine aminotransferase